MSFERSIMKHKLRIMKKYGSLINYSLPTSKTSIPLSAFSTFSAPSASQKYTLETHVYDATGDTIKGEKSLMSGAINSRINSKESVPIGTHNFFWRPNTSISSYISKYPIYRGTTRQITGFLVLELVPRNERASAVFSELLTSTAVKESSIEGNYDYAI